MCYCAKHANAGGSGGMPPKKIDALRLNLRAFQSQNIKLYCRVKITVKSRVIGNYKHHYGMENMGATKGQI